MNKEQQSDEAVANFVLEETKRRVAYLKLIKSKGLPIDEDQLAQFEQEVRDEEKRFGVKPESESVVVRQKDVVELQELLAYVEFFDDDFSGDDYIKAVLLKLEQLPVKVRMHAERNHQRPHFHIDFKGGEYSASYAVDNLERLAGNMPAKYEKPVMEWAAKHQRSLAATWTSLLAGQDVRELVLVSPET